MDIQGTIRDFFTLKNEEVEEGSGLTYPAYYFEITDAIKLLTKEKDRIKERAIEDAGLGYKAVERKIFSYTMIPEWARAKGVLKDVEKKYKAAYESSENLAQTVDPATGEVLELPEVSYSISLQREKQSD